MKNDHWMEMVGETVNSTLQDLKYKEVADLASKIQGAKRIFLMGRGRTGLVVEMFGMRLAQLGRPVYIVSHSTTPALEKNDFLILVSGTGETGEILNAAKLAKEIGAETFALTQNEESSLGQKVQEKLIIRSPQQDTKVLNGTLFELSLLIVLDAVVSELLELSGQNFEVITKRHANLG